MIRLARSLQAWGTPDFTSVLKEELEALDADLLPLQQGLSATSHALGGRRQALIHRVTEEAGRLQVRAGIFYTGIIAGCSCADDPTPIEEQTEYCEIRLEIDKASGEATVTLVTD